MEEVKTNALYRHFKGNYYYVENIAKLSETKEEVVIYRGLHEEESLWVRPLKMFMQKIDKNRKDNSTGQEYRFELVDDIIKKYI